MSGAAARTLMEMKKRKQKLLKKKRGVVVSKNKQATHRIEKGIK